MSNTINLESTLSSVTDQHSEDFPPRILIYGPHKIGKSTFAAEAPNPYFLDFENGLRNITKGDGTPIKLNKANCKGDYPKSKEVLKLLMTEKHDYQTLVVDTIDWMETALFAHLCKMHNCPSIIDNSKGSAFSFGRGIGMAVDELDSFLQGLDILNQRLRMAIILVAHNKIKTIEDPTTDAFEQHVLRMNDRMAGKICDWVDCILFAQNKVFVKDEKAIGGTRVLRAGLSPSFVSGGRYKLPDEMPLSWNGFMNEFIKANKGE